MMTDSYTSLPVDLARKHDQPPRGFSCFETMLSICHLSITTAAPLNIARPLGPLPGKYTLRLVKIGHFVHRVSDNWKRRGDADYSEFEQSEGSLARRPRIALKGQRASQLLLPPAWRTTCTVDDWDAEQDGMTADLCVHMVFTASLVFLGPIVLHINIAATIPPAAHREPSMLRSV